MMSGNSPNSRALIELWLEELSKFKAKQEAQEQPPFDINITLNLQQEDVVQERDSKKRNKRRRVVEDDSEDEQDLKRQKISDDQKSF